MKYYCKRCKDAGLTKRGTTCPHCRAYWPKFRGVIMAQLRAGVSCVKVSPGKAERVHFQLRKKSKMVVFEPTRGAAKHLESDLLRFGKAMAKVTPEGVKPIAWPQVRIEPQDETDKPE